MVWLKDEKNLLLRRDMTVYIPPGRVVAGHKSERISDPYCTNAIRLSNSQDARLFFFHWATHGHVQL